VAPASPFEACLAWRGLGWLAERYRVRYSRRIFERWGYLAGRDEDRLAELDSALHEPDVRAVLAVRGGYGSCRFVHELDWSVLRREPRWLVGFSDVTALHVEAAAQGVASIHGPNLTGLGRGDAVARRELLEALEAPLAARTWAGLRVVCPGRARGRLFGGNLTLLHACAAAGRLHVPRGALLLIEDVGERPYRLDRLLSTLRAGGHLQHVAGVVAGQFEQCSPNGDGRDVAWVLADLLAPLRIPVVLGAPVGHGESNRPVVLGAPGELAAEGLTGRLELVSAV
jgi:muramoyltetrapeptide carboxypeptidase